MEMIGLLASFIASSFALARMALSQYRTALDHMISFMLKQSDQQEEALVSLHVAVSENTKALAKVLERLRLSFSEKEVQ
jgi:hypothetical protein